jgi:hypothetical protein
MWSVARPSLLQLFLNLDSDMAASLPAVARAQIRGREGFDDGGEVLAASGSFDFASRRDASLRMTGVEGNAGRDAGLSASALRASGRDDKRFSCAQASRALLEGFVASTGKKRSRVLTRDTPPFHDETVKG